METTAIALFGSRISPRFDCTQVFLLVTSSASTVIEQHTENFQDQLPNMKIRHLADLKVDTLLCGGIDESSRDLLRSHGIKFIANLKGRVTEAVSCHVAISHL